MISTLATDIAMKPEHLQDFTESDFRILVVDDESSLRNFVASALAGAGYLVDTAGNATEALEKLHCGNFDFLLTDYHMPRKTGIDLIRQMRADGLEIPTVLMTGRPAELFTEHPGLQVNAVLSKPFMLSELLDITASVLRSIGNTEGLPPTPPASCQPWPCRRPSSF